MENVVSSEVNSFTLDVEDSGDLTTSKFLFSVPPELKYSLQRNGFQSLRRSRSNPIGWRIVTKRILRFPDSQVLTMKTLMILNMIVMGILICPDMQILR